MNAELRREIMEYEPRTYRGKRTYHDLTGTEKEQFIKTRIRCLQHSNLSKARKQASILGGVLSDLSTATAFKRYVEHDEPWFR